jgi:hypothetical protein
MSHRTFDVLVQPKITGTVEQGTPPTEPLSNLDFQQ